MHKLPMKIIIAVTTAVTIALLSACGGGSAPDKPSQPPGPQPPAPSGGPTTISVSATASYIPLAGAAVVSLSKVIKDSSAPTITFSISNPAPAASVTVNHIKDDKGFLTFSPSNCAGITKAKPCTVTVTAKHNTSAAQDSATTVTYTASDSKFSFSPHSIDFTMGAPKPSPTPTSGWDSCYFSSSGAGGPYTTSDIGKNETAIPNTGNGADPSCGDHDQDFFDKCIKPDLKYVTAFTKTNSICKGVGIIALVNPDNKGKVACFTHATYGSINKPSASSAYIDGKTNYNTRKKLIINIIKNCIKDGTYTGKVTIMQSDSCIIKKQAFIDAGVSGIYPSFAPNNGGVAISFGHGVADGEGGSFAYINKGGDGAYAKNTLLNFQVGMRAWSLEISDSFQKGDAEASQMLYLLQSGSQTIVPADNLCDQPLIKSLDDKLDDVDKLLNFVNGKL